MPSRATRRQRPSCNQLRTVASSSVRSTNPRTSGAGPQSSACAPRGAKRNVGSTAVASGAAVSGMAGITFVTASGTARSPPRAANRIESHSSSRGSRIRGDSLRTASHNCLASAASRPLVRAPASSKVVISVCSRWAVGWLTPASQSCTERRLTPKRPARWPWVSPVRPRRRNRRSRKEALDCKYSTPSSECRSPV